MSDDGEPTTDRCTLTISSTDAVALYSWIESDACPDWWDTPLAAIHEQLREHLLHEAPIGRAQEGSA
jgi:hypothetical protein